MKMNEEKQKRSILYSMLRWIWGVIPTVIILIVLGYFAYGLIVKIQVKKEQIKADKMAELKETPEINVIALELEPTIIRDEITLPGEIQPWIDLIVRAEVAGKVIQKKVSKGDQVKAGDILAVIDDRDYRNAYKAAETAYNLALISQERIGKLTKKKLAPKSQMDNAVAAVDNARIQMDNVTLALERCQIKAPIDGVISQLFFEEGSYLGPAGEVAQILQIDRVKVKVGIPESDVTAVRRINTFKVIIDALGNKQFKAKKHFLSPQTDPMAHLYNMDLVMDNANHEVLPDMFARIEIVKKVVKNGIAIPLYSIITRNDKHMVYIVNDEKAHTREVEIGLLDGWLIEITKGLKPGDRVIVMGHRSVSDDQPVNVVKTIKNLEELTE
jgi:membrane fusion protein (multidrug efflux system)